jgi:pimeloyl-ACP methyl ester carboxylesterase
VPATDPTVTQRAAQSQPAASAAARAPRRGRHVFARTLVVTALAMLAGSALAGVGMAAAAAPVCRSSQVRVSLTPLLPLATERIAVEFCVPAGQRPATVEVLVPGITYGRTYWDFPDPTAGSDRYSFVGHAIAAGYATLSLDRIGTGSSSHPLLGTLVDEDANAWTLHQVIAALRAGRVPAPATGERVSRVVLVGHSYGSIAAWLLASEFPADANGVILSSATHGLTPLGLLNAATNAWPAALDPGLQPPVLLPDYLTSRPGTRYDLFYAPASVDPAVVQRDEETKQTVTAGELATLVPALARPVDIRVPVLLAVGSSDSLFCAPGGATDCSSSQSLVADEAPHLGSRVPCLEGFVLPGAGHVINLMPNASAWFEAAQGWVARRVASPGGSPGGC